MNKAILVLAILAVVAFASDPRLDVLGGDARLLTNDYLEMWAYPGTIGDYEFVTGSSDDAGMYDGWFGLTKDFGGQTLGVTVHHDEYSHEVLYSPGGWGAILSFNYDKGAPTDSTTEKDMAIGLAWGTDVPIFANYSDLALMVGYDKESIDHEDYTLSQSNIMFGASLRGHGDGFMNLFPIVSAGINMYTDDQDEAGSFSESMINFDFGAGHNKMIAEKTNLVFGVYARVQSLSYGGDHEDMDSQMWIDIPRIAGGVEQMIGKWLVFRAGAESVNRYHSVGDFNEFSYGFNTNFGVGLHWDNFTLDGTIGEDFLHAGPYMVGGESNGFLSTVAATYTF